MNVCRTFWVVHSAGDGVSLSSGVVLEKSVLALELALDFAIAVDRRCIRVVVAAKVLFGVKDRTKAIAMTMTMTVARQSRRIRSDVDVLMC